MSAQGPEAVPNVLAGVHKDALAKVGTELAECTGNPLVRLEDEWVPHIVEGRILLAEQALAALDRTAYVEQERQLLSFLLKRYEHPSFVPGEYLPDILFMQSRGFLTFGGEALLGRLNDLLRFDNADGDAVKGVMRSFVHNRESPYTWIVLHNSVSPFIAWTRYHEAVCEDNARRGMAEVGNEESRERIREVADRLRPGLRPEEDEFNLAWQSVCTQLVRYAPVAGVGDVAVEYVRAKCDSDSTVLGDPYSCLEVLRFAVAVAKSPLIGDAHGEWLHTIRNMIYRQYGDSDYAQIHLELARLDIASAFVAAYPNTVIGVAEHDLSDGKPNENGHPTLSGELLSAFEQYVAAHNLAGAAEVLQVIPAHKTWATALLRYSQHGQIDAFDPGGSPAEARPYLFKVVKYMAAGYADAAATALESFASNWQAMSLLTMNDGIFVGECLKLIWQQDFEAGKTFFENMINSLQKEPNRRLQLMRTLCEVALTSNPPYAKAASLYGRFFLPRTLGRASPNGQRLSRAVLLARWTAPK